MERTIQAVAAAGILLLAEAQGFTRPEVPDSIKAPAGEDVILTAHAKGTQIYVCQVNTDKKYAWVFKAPEAELKDDAGKIIIHHFAGPTWKHIDGSEVKAKMVAKQDAPKTDASHPSIPWLLLSATGHSGEGVLSRVTSIQRIHTDGGMPVENKSCDASNEGKEVGTAYTADYYFYSLAH